MGRSRTLLVVGLYVMGFAVQAAMTTVHGEEPTKPGIGEKAVPDKGVKGNAFGTKNWKPAPPVKKMVKVKPMVVPPAVALPPAPPSAPPLPFVYIGRMVDEDVTTVFIANQQRNLAVKVGDTIDNVYRVEKIADNSMTLIYIPLNAQQQLSLGGAK